MARTLGTYSLSANIEMLAGAPLDAREIVPAKADLTTSGMFPYAYIGMETYVVSENKKYRLIGIDPTVPTNWEEINAGSEITPNPSTQATDDLSTIKINNTVYSIVDPTVPSWAKASSKPSYAFSEIGSTPTTLSGYGITDAKIVNGTITLGNNSITPLTSFTETDPTVPAWAKATNKPSYIFSEIGSTPTTLSGYGITDAKIVNGTITLGSNSITPLTSFTETDPTVPAWAKATNKPSYIFSEIGSTPTTLSGYGITDAKIVNGTITLGNNTITPVTDISGKADKSATVSTVAWDSSNNKLTKTINGSTTDVVTASTILNNLIGNQVISALGYTPAADAIADKDWTIIEHHVIPSQSPDPIGLSTYIYRLSTAFDTAINDHADWIDGLNLTNVSVTNTNPASGTDYYPVWHTSTSGTSGLKANNGLKYNTIEGTASAVGKGQLQLGNSTSSGTAGNKTGSILLFSEKNGYAIIKPTASSTNERIFTLPDKAGTIALTSDLSSYLPTTTKYAASPSVGGAATKVYGTYTGSGGQQGPGYYGTNAAGFLMSNATVAGDSHYKNWLYMDCYSGTDVGGATAIGVDRTEPRMFIMQSDANRSSWNNTAAVGVFTATPTSGQVIVSDGTTGGIKSSGYTIATSVPSNAVFTDTKNTAGTTNTTSKIYLAGATSQAANPQTYSNANCYASDGKLYSNSTEVLTLAGGTMTGTIVTPGSDSHGIRPNTNNYGFVGTPIYYYYNGYISNLSVQYLKGKSDSYIYVQNSLLPDGNIDIGSKNSKFSSIYGTCTSASTTAGSNMQAGTGWSEIIGGKRHIYLKASTNSIAISSTYGNLKYLNCGISFSSSLGFSVSKNGMVVGLFVQSGSGLNFCSLNALTDTAVAFYISCAQAESARQYTVYVHLVCDY